VDFTKSLGQPVGRQAVLSLRRLFGDVLGRRSQRV